ncbi:MAG: response regulator [Minisyncoccia bacterium]
MKILIIEDEEVLVRVLKEKFEDENFKASVVMEGTGAFSAAKKFMPDIILLDILLPNLNGIEVLSKFKADKILKDIPVIIISNLGDEDKVKHAFKLGAIDYMVKSLHPINEVVEKVNDYVLKAR